MPKNGFPMPTAKNRFHILNLHPKNMYLKKKYPFLHANLLEKFQSIFKTLHGNSIKWLATSKEYFFLYYHVAQNLIFI